MEVYKDAVIPDFSLNSTFGAFGLYEWLQKSWGLIFYFPSECLGDLTELAQLRWIFDERNAKILTVHNVSLAMQHHWIQQITRAQHLKINFPMISSLQHPIADYFEFRIPEKNLEMEEPIVAIINPDKVVKLVLMPMHLANFTYKELIHLLEALQILEEREQSIISSSQHTLLNNFHNATCYS